MKTKLTLIGLLISFLGLSALAQGTAFTYEGRLDDNGSPANGSHDFRFAIYEVAGGGPLRWPAVTNLAVFVSNGLFTVTLDFGTSAFTGGDRWLEIGVRPGGSATDFTTLAPRQQITPSPYSITAGNVSGNVSASQLTGTLPPGSISSGSITSSQLAPGAAAANLAASGVAGVPSTGIVLSEQAVNPQLLDAGYVSLGDQITNRLDTWASIANGPPASGVLSLGRYNHAAVWIPTINEMLVVGGYPNRHGLRHLLAANAWAQITTNGMPNLRENCVAVWTGTRLLAWDTATGSGGLYNPANNTWQSVTAANAPSPRVKSAWVWTGNRLLIWGGHPPLSSAYFRNDGRSYDPATDTWHNIQALNPQFARWGAAAIWTGTEMIVTKGAMPEGSGIDLVLHYNPALDTWDAFPTGLQPRFDHTAVWTGSRVILVGGKTGASTYATAGVQYDPVTHSWVNIAGHAILTELAGHRSVWSGSHMFVWGGESNPNGARYTPATDTWTVLPAPGTSARIASAAVWTGANLLVWGGRFLNTDAETDDGRRYNLTSNNWTALSVPPGTGEPSQRNNATGIWTGDRLIVWGGNYLGTDLRSGGIYQPGIGWTSTPIAGAPSARSGHTAIWTGTEMIIWGGADGFTVNTGARFHVASNKWFTLSTDHAPTTRRNHSAIWTGTEMIIWGGYQITNLLGTTFLNSGGRYNPTTDLWETNFPVNALISGRANHTAVWTGTEMLIWGGYQRSGSIINPTFTYFANGARHTPRGDTLLLLPVPPAGNARTEHSAVWTGTEMLVWGGLNAGGELSSGLRFDPALNLWTALPNDNAPTVRAGHTGVWTGQWLLIYGGSENQTPKAGTYFFDPVANLWSSATTNVAARYRHVGVWTGTNLFVGTGQIGAAPTNSWHSFAPRRIYHFYQKP